MESSKIWKFDAGEAVDAVDASSAALSGSAAQSGARGLRETLFSRDRRFP